MGIYVEKCINSILNNKGNIQIEIIVVDNYSEESLSRLLPNRIDHANKEDVHFLWLDKNYGFGYACNVAAKTAKGTLLCFLNPDTVINENIFAKIIEHHKKSDKMNIGIMGLNVSESKFIDYSAGYFPNLLSEILNIFSLGRFFEAFLIKIKTKVHRLGILNLDWVMGAAFCISKDFFIHLNGFDPNFFLYFEEMDLCKRARNTGANIEYISKIKVHHIGSAGSKKNYYFFTKMFYKGKLLFINKHYKQNMVLIFNMLIKLHIYLQILLWLMLIPRDKIKSMGKINAFKEVLENLGSPTNINNSAVPN